eukprot:Hpha_TRINITY_DN15014_c2_g9::TRINITY_DN15014_c2_g9_i1::g.124427::m.124427
MEEQEGAAAPAASPPESQKTLGKDDVGEAPEDFRRAPSEVPVVDSERLTGGPLEGTDFYVDMDADTLPTQHPTARSTQRGCVRGEVLWYRPEWERPWRTRKQQKGADTMAVKEAELEVQIERNTALRRQLHQARQELRRAAQTAELRDKEIADIMMRDNTRHKSEVDSLQLDNRNTVAKLERRIEALQRAHEQETSNLRRRLSAEEERCARAQEEGRKQLIAQGLARDEEIAQLKVLLDMKDTEIASVEKRRSDQLHTAAEERERSNTDLRLQLVETEKRFQAVIDEQHKRSEEGVDSSLRQIAEFRQELDSVRTERDLLTVRCRALEQRVQDCDGDRDRWTRRVGAEVDGMIDELGGVSMAVPELAGATVKGDSPLDAHVCRRMAELRRLQLGQREELARARSGRDDAWRDREASARTDRDRWAERDQRLGELAAEVDRTRMQQSKIQRAMRQHDTCTRAVSDQAGVLADRLRFFTEDRRDAEGHLQHQSSMGLPPPLANAELTIVCCAVADAVALRAAAPDATDAGLVVARDTIRLKLRQHGGHEAWGSLEGWVFVFRHAADAVAFALSVQVALVHAPWPAALLALPACGACGAADGTGTLWRGMRVRCGVSHGVVKVTSRLVGSSGHLLPETRKYHGDTVRECLSVLSLAAPGQVLLTEPAREAVCTRLEEIPPHVTVDVGPRRVIVSGATPKVHLWDVRAAPLAGRAHPPAGDSAAAEPPALPSGLLDILSAEVDSLAKGRELLDNALTALTQETEEVGATSVRLASRLRDLRNARPWNPEDLVPVLTELDQTVMKQETSRAQLADAFHNQDTLLRAVRLLETSLAAHGNALLSDAEARRMLATREAQLRGEIQELDEAHQARERHMNETAQRKEYAISGLRAEREQTGGVLDALQRELDYERRAHVDVVANADSRISELERKVARERALNPSRRWEREKIPQCADHRPARGSAASYARSPRTPGVMSRAGSVRQGSVRNGSLLDAGHRRHEPRSPAPSVPPAPPPPPPLEPSLRPVIVY